MNDQSPMQARAVLAPDHTGARVNYQGLLQQSQNGLRREPGLAEMLRQLMEHLTEMGQRFYAGDVTAVDEFLQLYCIERETRAALASHPQPQPAVKESLTPQQPAAAVQAMSDELRDAQILAAARALNKITANACNVDEADHWALFGNIQITDAATVLRAAWGVKLAGAAGEGGAA